MKMAGVTMAVYSRVNSTACTKVASWPTVAQFLSPVQWSGPISG